MIPDEGFKAVNGFILYVSIPSFILSVVPGIDFTPDALLPVAMSWGVFLLAIPVFLMIGKVFKLPKSVVGCLILVCGLGNTSFLGFPLLNYFLGPESLQYGVLADVPGSFLILPTLGILIASLAGSAKPSAGMILKRIFTFPPFLAFVAALALIIFSISLPKPVSGLFELVGKNTLIPLALFSVGLQLNLKFKGMIDKPLLLGLAYKLLLAPVLIFAVYFLLMGRESLEAQASVLEAGMPPMITASIVAVEFDLSPKLANALVSVGIPVSFLTVYGFYLLIS